MVTNERIHELLNYDQETGKLTWLVRRGGKASAGSEAGKFNAFRHRQIRIDRVTYMAHRIAWQYVYGVIPSGDIDHINGIPYDNRIANLRDVTRSENCQNVRRARLNSKTGVLGVTKRDYGYYAIIGIGGGKQKFLGSFSTPELAHAAYIEAKRKYHKGCMI